MFWFGSNPPYFFGKCAWRAVHGSPLFSMNIRWGKVWEECSRVQLVCHTCQMAEKVTDCERETRRNSYPRGIEQLAALRLRWWKRTIEALPSWSWWNESRIQYDSAKKSQNSPRVRQVNEALRIIISKPEYNMNSKSEWHQAPLVRIIPMSRLQEDQGYGRGSLLQGGERREGPREGRWQGQDKIWDQLIRQQSSFCLHYCVFLYLTNPF